MTRTENDLRSALAAAEQDAPDAGDLLDRVLVGAARRGRARWAGGAVAAALALVLTGVTVPVAVAALHRHGTPTGTPTGQPCAPAAQAGQRTRWQLTVSLPGYQIRSEFAGATNQQLIAWLPGRPVDQTQPAGAVLEFDPGTVMVYDPGALSAADLAAATSGQRTTVNGHPAYRNRIHDPSATVRGATVDSIGWQCPDGSVVTVLGTHYSTTGRPVGQPGSTPITDGELAALAAAVRVTERYGVPLPFQVGWLPSGLTYRFGTNFWDTPAGPPRTELVFGVAGGTDQTGLDIQALDTRPVPSASASPRPHQAVIPSGPPSAVVDGHPVWVADYRVTVAFEGYEALVGYLPNPGGAPVKVLPMTDLIRIAESLRPVRSWPDRSTWYDASAQPALRSVR
jgi:hypothetical protein